MPVHATAARGHQSDFAPTGPTEASRGAASARHASPTAAGHRFADLSTVPDSGGSIQANAAEGAVWEGGSPADVQRVAVRGITGAGSTYPHIDRIRKSFGRHAGRLGGIRAFFGSIARRATRALGASAYSTRGRTAFRSHSPSVFEAAHEMTHHLHQQEGLNLQDGKGKVGDKYERHADQVGRAVASGQSAEHLLGPVPSGGGGGGGGEGGGGGAGT